MTTLTRILTILALSILLSGSVMTAAAEDLPSEPSATPTAEVAPSVEAPAITEAEPPYAVYLPGIQTGEKYPAYARAHELELLRLVNEARAASGLHPLVEDPALTQAARRHTYDMAAHDMHGHLGSDGTWAWHRAEQEGYTGRLVSEAFAYAGGGTAQQSADVWMASPPHRAILLDPTATEAGIGFVYDPGYIYLYASTLDTGTR